MKLFYTGAKLNGEVQYDPELSLGGFISSTEIENDVAGNLFSDITEMAKSSPNAEHKLIALKNDTGGDLTNVTLHFEYPAEPAAKLLIGAIVPTLVSGAYVFNSIQSSKSKPNGITFYEADGILNAVNLGNLADGEYLGLWLRRELLISEAECAVLAGDTYESVDIVIDTD